MALGDAGTIISSEKFQANKRYTLEAKIGWF
jgi:hypothetical protein